MKICKYRIAYEVNIGTEDNPVIQTFYTDKTTTDEQIAKREAYNGHYTIEDDGQPEPEPTTEASTDDIINAMLGVS